MSSYFDNFQPELIERVAPQLLGEHEDGETWTYRVWVEHVSQLKFAELRQLESKFEKLMAAEKAARAAEFNRIQSDPVLNAQAMLADAEKALHAARGPLDGLLRDLAEHDDAVATIERRRKLVKHKPDAWLASTRELESARIERERLALLVAEQQAEIDQCTPRLTKARAALEVAKQAQALASNAA